MVEAASPRDAPEEASPPAGRVPVAGGGGVAHTVHPAASRLAACCNVWWLLQYPVSVCSWTALTEEQGSKHMVGTSLHFSNRLHGLGLLVLCTPFAALGLTPQSAAPMTSGYLFTASLVMEEEPEV